MKKIVSAAVLMLLIFISCNSNHKKELNPGSVSQAPPANENIALSDQLQTGDQPLQSTDTNSSKPVPVVPASNTDWDKKIIKTASLTLEVSDFRKYNEEVYKTVKQMGGYVAQEKQDLTAGRNESAITIKVPVYQFESMMNLLPGAGTKVLERNIQSDDVTGKIVDTRSRLEAKKEVRQKYLEFLKQSKNMKDVLQVQSEINAIQEEMEAAAAQVNYLSHQSAMSTINLTFFQNITGVKPQPETVAPSFLSRLSKSLKSGAAWLADLLIGIASVWPLVLIIIAVMIVWK